MSRRSLRRSPSSDCGQPIRLEHFGCLFTASSAAPDTASLAHGSFERLRGVLVLLAIAGYFALSFVVVKLIIGLLHWGFRYGSPGPQRWTRRTTTSIVLAAVIFAGFAATFALLGDA